MLDKSGKIIIKNDKNEEIECDVLFTFDNNDTKKSYIVYTDNTKDEEGNIQVYASIYDPENPNSKFEAITTEKEWKVIETILETLQEEVQKQSTSNNEE